MAPLDESTTEWIPNPSPAVQDRRIPPRGVLPKSLQTWLMVGIACVIVAIILITGHPKPLVPTRSSSAAAQPALAPTDRIRSYQQRLAEEEARQQDALARTAPTGAESRATTRTVPVGSAADENQRASRSLLADNIALSRRPSGQQPYAEPAVARESASPSAAPVSSSGLDPLAQVLTRALTQAPTANLPSRAAVGAAGRAAAEPLRSSGEPAVATPAELRETATPKAAENPAPGPRFPVLEGTVIETVLLNRLDGTFAGPVAGLVTTPVYSQDRQRVLVPAGARVLGAAAPVQAWGDARLAVSFHRLVMPDGHTYSLDLFKGLDAVGETGLRDTVNHHYGQVFGASLAIGALSGLAQYNTRSGFGVTDSGDQFRQAAGGSLANSTSSILDRYLNVLPTVTIREGHRIKVYLTNDLALPVYAATTVGGAR